MSQHNVKCPKCGNTHEMDAFRSGGVANALFTLGNSNCNFSTEDKREINKLLGLQEIHRQRMLNYEMPRDEGEGDTFSFNDCM